MTAADSQNPPNGVLAGLKVLDLSTLLAGPFAGALLADFGAHVIKVEDPARGDPIRGFPPMLDGVSLGAKVTNRGKECITLDLRSDAGQGILRRLAAGSDVVITNFRPATLRKWGLDHDVLSRDNPGLIMLHITGFGRTGPYADRPGFARVAEAFSGLMGITGAPDGPPTPIGYPIVDGITGALGALGVLLAVRERDRSGLGQVVDASLFESVLRLLEDLVVDHAATGRIRPRAGFANPNVAPNGLFRCQDDVWVVIPASTDQMFIRLCSAMGRPDLAASPRFADNPSRVRNRAELDGAITTWCADRPASEVGRRLDEAAVGWSRVQTAADLLDDPQVRERGALVRLSDPELHQDLTMPGVSPRLSRTPGAVTTPGRAKGADSQEVLRRELGIDDAEFAQLRDDRIV